MPPKKKRSKKNQPPRPVAIERCFYCRSEVGANNWRHIAQCEMAKKHIAARDSYRGNFIDIKGLQDDEVMRLIGHQPPRGCTPPIIAIAGEHASMNVETGSTREAGPLQDQQNRQSASLALGQSIPLEDVDVDLGADDGFFGDDDAWSLGEEEGVQELEETGTSTVATLAAAKRVADAFCGLDLDEAASCTDVNFEERLAAEDVETAQWKGESDGVQFQFTAERKSYEEERAAWESQLVESQRVQAIADSGGLTEGYHHIPHWSWKVPPGSSHALSKEIVEDEMIGVCMQVPPNSHLSGGQMFTDSELSMIRLIDYLDMRPQTSRKTLDGLIKIIREETEERGFDPWCCTTRETIADKVKKKYGIGQEPLVARLTASSSRVAASLVEEESEGGRKKTAWEIKKEAQMSDRYSVNIIAFSVRDGILDLLDDIDIFGNLDNLVVNHPPENPFDPYVNNSGFSRDVLDGTWYSQTVEFLKNLDPTEKPFVPGLDFLVPINMYLDKTGTDNQHRYSLEPVVFTLAIIKRFLRNYTRSWRLAGYVPDLESKSAAEMAVNRRKQEQRGNLPVLPPGSGIHLAWRGPGARGWFQQAA